MAHRTRVPCSIDGCSRPKKVRGWCDGHYHRFRKYGDPLGGGSTRVVVAGSLTERIWSKIRRTDSGCWEWQGSRQPFGYGLLSVGGQTRSAHRTAYELLVGPIPEGLELDHLCRNPPCVNPSHLEPVTASENVRRQRRHAASVG